MKWNKRGALQWRWFPRADSTEMSKSTWNSIGKTWLKSAIARSHGTHWLIRHCSKTHIWTKDIPKLKLFHQLMIEPCLWSLQNSPRPFAKHLQTMKESIEFRLERDKKPATTYGTTWTTLGWKLSPVVFYHWLTVLNTT